MGFNFVAFLQFTGGRLFAKVNVQPLVVRASGLCTFTASNRAGWMGKTRRLTTDIAAASASLKTRRCAMETATLVDGNSPPGLRCEKPHRSQIRSC